MNWKEIGLRFLWTVLAAVGGVIASVQTPGIGIEVVQAAGMAGIMAALTFITLLARDVLGGLGPSSHVSRLVWTFIQAGTAALIASPIFDIPGVKAAFTVAAIATVNELTLLARSKAETIHPPADRP